MMRSMEMFLLIISLGLFSLSIKAQDLVSSGGETMTAEEQVAAKKMLENPEQFNSEIKDITKGHHSFAGMTAEMVKFYTAVALVESKNCFLKNDPTGCEMFWESLKDPVGHVGFISFMMAANKGTEAALYLSRGKLPKVVASNIGLMIGMMVQDVLVEFVKSPHTKELMNLPNDARYPTLDKKMERARELKNKLWKETFGSREWRDSKAIQGISLLAAVALSSGTQQILARTATGTIALATRAAAGGSRVAVMGLRLGRAVMMGSRVVRLFSPIGLAITGIVIFLEWSGFTEKYIAHPMRLGTALRYTYENRKMLEKAIERNSPVSVQRYSEELGRQYFKLRATVMEASLQKHAGHEKILEGISKNFLTVTKYMEWLARGMQGSSYDENDGNWHREKLVDDLYYDRGRFIEGFFCGPQPKNAIRVYRDLSGLPIPFQTYHVDDYTTTMMAENTSDSPSFNLRDIEIRTYKSFSLENACDDDIKKLNPEKFNKTFAPGRWDKMWCPINIKGGRFEFGKFWMEQRVCQYYQMDYRSNVLRTGILNGRNVRRQLVEAHLDALETLIAKYEKLRTAYIKRYEVLIYKDLLKELVGRDVTVLENNFVNERGIRTRIQYEHQLNTSDYFVSGRAEYSREIVIPFSENVRLMEGALPLLQEEIIYYDSLKAGAAQDAPFLGHLDKAKKTVEMQQEYSRKLRDFMERSMAERDRTPDLDLIFNEETWVPMAKFYQNFILN